MNQEFGKQAFDQAEKLFKDARIPENVQAIAQQGVAVSKEYYSKAAAAAQDGAKAMNEIADTAWGSTKMLNEMIVQNLTANAEAAFRCGASDRHRQVAAGDREAPKRVRSEVCRTGDRTDQGVRRFVDPGHAPPVREGAIRSDQVIQVQVVSAYRSGPESRP